MLWAVRFLVGKKYAGEQTTGKYNREVSKSKKNEQIQKPVLNAAYLPT